MGVESITGAREQSAAVLDSAVASLVEHRLREVLHDVRQPLAAVFALAEEARGAAGVPREVRDRLDRLIDQVAEIATVAVNALAGDEAAEPPGDGLVDVREVLDSVVDAFALTWSGRMLQRGGHAPLHVRGRRVTLRRCLVNLVDNAVRAAGPDGTVVVTARRMSQCVRVFVEDDGPGFGRMPRRSGVGLETSRRALARMGGGLSVGLVPSQVGGARVALSLPLPGSPVGH